ncbi:hypothetical protein LFADAHJC_LOCUS3592 [Methylorubrum extorquens]
MFRLPTPAASGGGPSQPTRQKTEACGCCHSRLGIVREEAGMRRRDGSGRPGRDPSRMCELYTCACSPIPARIACCRRGHDGECGRPDDTSFAVFQEAVTAPGRRNGRLPASCISLRVKIPGPTRREAVGVEPSRPAGIPRRLGRGRRGIWSAATNGQACLRRYLHDVLACSSTNRLLSSLNPASRLNQKLLMTACQMARRSRKFRLNSALRNKSRPAAIRRRPRKPYRVVP